MHRVTTTFLLVMVASLLLGDQAEGHLVAQAREMLITVGPEDVEVRTRLFLHEGPEAARLRAAADLDGDGLVSNGAEQDGLSLRLKALATSELSLTLNETALPLALDYQRLALDGGPGVE
ncbi:MAG TPA: hypothetical protein DIU15_00720, partial [Deltaproteobacteria bacterium]|nr:hypothetical protein [Deltaproteobacteria bacterium]